MTSDPAPGPRPAVYDPSIFRRPRLQGAKRIILETGETMTSEERWERETPWTVERLAFDSPTDLLLDFGCGIGRIARLLSHPIIGVDMAPEMRRHAAQYVDRPDFAAVAPVLFRRLVREGLRCDGGYAIWALQHVFDPEKEIATIARALRPRARFWVLNTLRRCVPTDQGWSDDGKDLSPILDRYFALVAEHAIDRTVVNVASFFRCYRSR